MHIKKLEISGFKSFVDRTVIHFDHDVIGIVGPNGCGKANIVDSIRWCMGEQSAKHLRGRSMEDVIFNGSESRPAHGLAEVTLTFDNTDPTYAATLPIEYRDYPEIAVTRRLFRDGTSEYLLNKTQVRLRDMVVDLDHPRLGALPTLGAPIRTTDAPPFRPAPPPALGEHTDAILGELLGYPPDRLAALRGQGVIG